MNLTVTLSGYHNYLAASDTPKAKDAKRLPKYIVRNLQTYGLFQTSPRHLPTHTKSSRWARKFMAQKLGDQLGSQQPLVYQVNKCREIIVKPLPAKPTQPLRDYELTCVLPSETEWIWVALSTAGAVAGLILTLELTNAKF